MADDEYPNRVRQFRRALKLSQRDVARALDTSPEVIGRLENGKVKLSTRWMARLAPVLKCRPTQLLKETVRVGEDIAVPLVGRFKGHDQGYLFEGDLSSIEFPSAVTLTGFVVESSLLPSYGVGDIIICQRADDVSRSCLGRECVVKTASGAIYIKWLYSGSRSGTYRLESIREADLDNVQVRWASPVLWVRKAPPEPVTD